MEGMRFLPNRTATPGNAPIPMSRTLPEQDSINTNVLGEGGVGFGEGGSRLPPLWGFCRKVPPSPSPRPSLPDQGSPMNKLLVLGIGNMLLTDDGVGVFASQELMKENWPEQVTVREGGTFTQDIFYSFKGYSHLLVLDVVHCGGKPGTLYRLTEDALIKDDKQRLSIHDIDLIDSLRMAEKLFGAKSELLVLGVEPKDYVTWNIGLSEDVQAVFPEFLALARKEIGEWLKRYGTGEARA